MFQHTHRNFFLSAFYVVWHTESFRMVYGTLGKRGVPLPACVYHQIRKTFPVGEGELHTGFEVDEEEM